MTTDCSFARNRLFRRTRSVFILAVLFAGAAEVWGHPRAVATDTEVAEKFVVDLNKGNTQELIAVSGVPFVFRNQEWESAKDGSGFVHGRAEDKSFRNRKALAKFLGTLVNKVKIENEKAAATPPSKDTLLSDNLKGSPPDWRKLKVVVFGRGFGDVEHVAIIGVDSTKHLVRGLYLN